MRRVVPKNASLVPPQAKRVFKGIIYDIYHWEQQMYDGSYQTFEMLKRPDTLKVIAVKDNKIVLLEQEQPDRDEAFYDLPGGRHDNEHEDELEGIKRELLEETGMSFKQWKLVEVLQPQGKIEQFVYIFVATEFNKQVRPSLDAGEKIKVHLVSFEELKKLAEDPTTRYLPKELLRRVSSLEELLSLPEYS